LANNLLIQKGKGDKSRPFGCLLGFRRFARHRQPTRRQLRTRRLVVSREAREPQQTTERATFVAFSFLNQQVICQSAEFA
jgi:hypothetical protein